MTNRITILICVVSIIANTTILHEGISHQRAIEKLTAQTILHDTPEQVIKQDADNTERAFKALEETQ